MNIMMEEDEFMNTKDHEIFNDLSEYMYENEKYNEILYHFTLTELYNFFNKHINLVESIKIYDSSDDEYDYLK